MSGADAPALRWFAALARRGRHDVDALRDRVTLIVERLPWQGPDRERFVDEWRHVHALAITAASTELADLADRAERAADRQDAAARPRP